MDSSNDLQVYDCGIPGLRQCVFSLVIRRDYVRFRTIGPHILLPAIGRRRGAANGSSSGAGPERHGFHSIQGAGHSHVARLRDAGIIGLDCLAQFCIEHHGTIVSTEVGVRHTLSHMF